MSEFERPCWVVIRDPGCVPVQKGPWRHDQVARFLREVFEARPYSEVEVITVYPDGRIDVQDGPECLMMTDGRSVSVARKHNERLRSCRTAPVQ